MNLAYKKILGKFTKVLGFGKTPPHVGKNSQIMSYFFSESVPYLVLSKEKAKHLNVVGWIAGQMFNQDWAQIN